jgi:hypothetical protein
VESGESYKEWKGKKLVKEINKLILLSVATLPLNIWIHGINE